MYRTETSVCLIHADSDLRANAELHTYHNDAQAIQGHLRDNVLHFNVPAHGFFAAQTSAPHLSEQEVTKMLSHLSMFLWSLLSRATDFPWNFPPNSDATHVDC